MTMARSSIVTRAANRGYNATMTVHTIFLLVRWGFTLAYPGGGDRGCPLLTFGKLARTVN
jgi:hypothetical protein